MAELSSSTDIQSVVSPYDGLHRLYTRLGAMRTILSSVSIASLPGYLLVEIAYIAPGIKMRDTFRAASYGKNRGTLR